MSLIPTQERPFAVDCDTLYILAQTPSVQFIYWQISTCKGRLLQAHYQKDWRSLAPSLRFHEVNDLTVAKQPSESVLELSLPPGESCFLSGLISGHTYFASLGIRNEQGQFLPLLRSNTIQIPRTDTRQSPDAAESDQPFLYQPTTLLLPQVTPDAHEHFSAYSVYVPKNTYFVDTESGGDTD